MQVLLLGPDRPEFRKHLERYGDSVEPHEDPIGGDSTILQSADFIISYGYRYLLPQEVIDEFPGRAINLHISMLPWNRGADPNLWSFLEDTPKGVSIHLIDRGIDTGPILFQQEMFFGNAETLSTTYEKLSTAVQEIFLENWQSIKAGLLPVKPQTGMGSFHKKSDKQRYEHLLYDGWNTPVAFLIGKAL